MDVVGLVVEPERRRVRSPEADFGFRHLDRQVQCVVVPGGVGDGAQVVRARKRLLAAAVLILEVEPERLARVEAVERSDRKSTRLNSSHRTISYAVFCLKKKKMKHAIWPSCAIIVAVPASRE